MIKYRHHLVKEATYMLLLLHGNFTFKIKGKKRAYVENGILKIDSTYVHWEDMMYALAYKLSKDDSCLYCGAYVKKKDLTLDHLFPRTYGGISISNNLLPCCRECNSAKNSLDGVEFWNLKKRKTEAEKNEFRDKVIQEKEQNRYITGFLLPEKWVEYCDINMIKIRGFYQTNYTESQKLIENKQYIEKYGHFKRPIIVDKNYWVLDGYNWYLAGKQEGFDIVPIIRLENVELIVK